MNNINLVFDSSVFQYIKDTFYEKNPVAIKFFLVNNIISNKTKIYTTDYVKFFIKENLGAISMIFDDILYTDENINIDDNNNSIIKLFSIKQFEGDKNFCLISNNSLLRDKIKSMGYDVYSVSEFESNINDNK
ncbi:MAG: hypothetical protein PHX47_03490 [Candidatus ainarchaeum sp.]|nr:hypothetical protein [Candidatus ainarchaeum sp.]